MGDEEGQVATISEVASRAGVSPATVSRVLTGKPHVADETRARVLAAARDLGYVPSRVARTLARGRSDTIGVVAHLSDSPSVTERFQGLSTRLAPSPHDLSLFEIGDPSRRDSVMADLASPDRVGVVVLISMTPTPKELIAFGKAGVPVVAVDARVADLDCVFVDNVEGGRLAARTLLTSGHRKMAFVGDLEDDLFGFTASRDRRIGFEDVLASASIQLSSDRVKLSRHSWEAAKADALELLDLDEPPTAIFAASDVQASGVLEAARERGIDIPGQLSVIGFDDIRAARSMGLTTIRQPLEESGAYGAKLALEAIEHRPMGMAIELPLSLVSRRSTGPPPT